jgi:hypothetical protein
MPRKTSDDPIGLITGNKALNESAKKLTNSAIVPHSTGRDEKASSDLVHRFFVRL